MNSRISGEDAATDEADSNDHPQLQIESPLKGMISYTTEALRESLSITVIAAPRNLGATSHGIPSGISPLNARAISHDELLNRKIGRPTTQEGFYSENRLQNCTASLNRQTLTPTSPDSLGPDGPAELPRHIDNRKWNRLMTAVTIPFDPPESGQVAVKVIDKAGMETMRVMETGI